MTENSTANTIDGSSAQLVSILDLHIARQNGSKNMNNEIMGSEKNRLQSRTKRVKALN